MNKINEGRADEALRSPLAQDEMKNIFNNEFSRMHLHLFTLINEFDEVQASLSNSLLVLFHAIKKPQVGLTNLNQYKKRRLAISQYQHVLEALNQAIELKEEARNQWLKYVQENEDGIYRLPRQGKFILD